jgi:Radical SAM superfamily/Wzt C-terminal domain/Iron-sulfur cluster-binding domain
LAGFPYCDFPQDMMVQTTSRCNSSCIFCPYQVVSKEIEHTVMPPELFERLMAECGEHSGMRTFCLFLMNEPLVDPDIRERIVIARKYNPDVCISIFTNGCDLNLDLARSLLDSGVSHLTFGVNAHWPETYRTITNRKDFEQVKQNITRFLELRNEHAAPISVDIRLVGALQLLSEEEIAEAKEYWKPFDVRSIEVFLGHTTRAGNLAGTYQVRHPQIYGCRDGMPYYRAAILSSGDVTLCCMDWRREVILGNVNDATLHEIWNSERRREVLAYLHNEESSPVDFLCKRCLESLPYAPKAAQAPGDCADSDVAILTCETQDSDGEYSTAFHTGESMTVTINFLTQREIPNPLIRIQIFNDQNQAHENLFYFGTNTNRGAVQMEYICPGEWEARFELHQLNLGAGHYTLTAGIWPDEESETAYDAHHGRLHFRIWGDATPLEPKVHIPADWVLSKASAETDDDAEPSLTALTLQAQDGSTREVFFTAGGLRIAAEFTVPAAQRYHTRVAILREELVLFHSIQDKMLPAGVGSIELSIPSLNLLSGSHQVEVQLLDSQADDPVCQLSEPLEVESHSEDGAGLAYCPWAVKVDRPMNFDESKHGDGVAE